MKVTKLQYSTEGRADKRVGAVAKSEEHSVHIHTGLTLDMKLYGRKVLNFLTRKLLLAMSV